MSPKEPASVLIFRIGSIGDTVVALPCFHAIDRAFPRHRKILLTNAVASARESSVESVLKGSGLIDETVYFPVGSGQLTQSLGVWREVRRVNPDVLVYLAPRPDMVSVYRDLAWFLAAGIRRIIGAPLTLRTRDCLIDPLTGEFEYEAERLARSLGPAMAVDLSAANWDLHLSAAEQAVAERHLAPVAGRRPLCALAPAAKIPEKDWGEEHWAQLIKVLQARIGPLTSVFIGAPEERAQTERLASLWGGPKVNLCGLLTPRESAAVLGRCDLLVCHDSGPMHLAASQGTQCVALFGTYNKPHRWFPFGNAHRVIHDSRGVRNITVQQVVEAVESVLVTQNQALDTRQLAAVRSS
jgi:lipopolysaccharide heptosyltransferase III